MGVRLPLPAPEKFKTKTPQSQRGVFGIKKIVWFSRRFTSPEVRYALSEIGTYRFFRASIRRSDPLVVRL